MRKLAVAVAVAVTTFFAQGIQAQAAVTDAFDGAITCTTQPAIPLRCPAASTPDSGGVARTLRCRGWQHR